MSGHTPGPWTVGISADNGIHCVDCEDVEICEVWGAVRDKVETEESAANARLIAAAPELLEALETAAEALEAAEFFEKAAMARAAIAKAKGEV